MQRKLVSLSIQKTLLLPLMLQSLLQLGTNTMHCRCWHCSLTLSEERERKQAAVGSFLNIFIHAHSITSLLALLPSFPTKWLITAAMNEEREASLSYILGSHRDDKVFVDSHKKKNREEKKPGRALIICQLRISRVHQIIMLNHGISRLEKKRKNICWIIEILQKSHSNVNSASMYITYLTTYSKVINIWVRLSEKSCILLGRYLRCK